MTILPPPPHYYYYYYLAGRPWKVPENSWSGGDLPEKEG